jgi:hypothetical protein
MMPELVRAGGCAIALAFGKLIADRRGASDSVLAREDDVGIPWSEVLARLGRQQFVEDPWAWIP